MIRSEKGVTPLNLLSATEWRVVHQLHRLNRSATAAEICQSMGSAAPADEIVEAVLARLSERNLVKRSDPGWLLTGDLEPLFRAQIQRFFDTYIDNDPLGCALVREVLDAQER
jgi:hypothetical protein